jgi:hypothetical protein
MMVGASAKERSYTVKQEAREQFRNQVHCSMPMLS